MVNLDASTPQLKAVKNWLDAYFALDMDSVGPLVSKDFQYQALPETPDLPKESQERHIERYREMLAVMSKFGVRIRTSENRLRSHRLISLSQGHLSRSDRSTGESCRPRSSLYAEPSRYLRP
jgi:hypothetical protein